MTLICKYVFSGTCGGLTFAFAFKYNGQSSPHKAYYIDGVRTHERTIFARYGTNKQEELKKILGDSFVAKDQEETKSRYYYILAQNKKEKKEILSKIKVKTLPYLKGDNKRYNVFETNNFKNLNGDGSSNVDDEVVGNMTIFDFL